VTASRHRRWGLAAHGCGAAVTSKQHDVSVDRVHAARGQLGDQSCSGFEPAMLDELHPRPIGVRDARDERALRIAEAPVDLVLLDALEHTSCLAPKKSLSCRKPAPKNDVMISGRNNI
jgi:hypothetical protein